MYMVQHNIFRSIDQHSFIPVCVGGERANRHCQTPSDVCSVLTVFVCYIFIYTRKCLYLCRACTVLLARTMTCVVYRQVPHCNCRLAYPACPLCKATRCVMMVTAQMPQLDGVVLWPLTLHTKSVGLEIYSTAAISLSHSSDSDALAAAHTGSIP